MNYEIMWKQLKSNLESKEMQAEQEKDNAIKAEDYAFGDGKETGFAQALNLMQSIELEA